MGYSDFQPDRRIVDWADDVADLATALGLEQFSVVGSSGGAAYALVCAARMPERVRLVGVIGGVAPADAPGGQSGPLRVMFSLARVAPALLRGLFRLQLPAIRRGGERGRDRMAAWAPEPDRTLLKRAEIAHGFMRCFEEACRRGPLGAAIDVALIARPWGFDLAAIRVPVLLWHGEGDRNVPVASGKYFADVLPNCSATFYPTDAHLSVPLQHQDEILHALATSSEQPGR
jgi:pimeloyl-ACP methyl ester carboxylesterase